jgi:hypothetical protein
MNIIEMEEELMSRMRAAGLEVPSRDKLLEEYRKSERYRKLKAAAESLAARHQEHFENLLSELVAEERKDVA